jgi:hypothetical protein
MARDGQAVGRVYDKAEWHLGSCEENGLSDDHAYMHTAVFICWLADRNLLDVDFLEGDEAITKIRRREGKPIDLYEQWDGWFPEDMMTPTGRAFAAAYFDFDQGSYINDYVATLARGLKNEFHVPVSWESYERMVPVIDARFREFSGGTSSTSPNSAGPWWRFWRR